MIKCLKTQNQQLREELKLIDKPGKLLLSINYILNGYYFPLNLICTFGCLKIKFNIPPGKIKLEISQKHPVQNFR